MTTETNAVNAPLRETCPVCSERDIELLGKTLTACLSCAHWFQNPPVVQRVYDFQYVDSRYCRLPSVEPMSWLRTGLVRSFASEGRLLDVGYGEGSFLKAAAKAGFDCWGSDVHGQGDRFGVRDIPLEEAAAQRWNVVTMFDSIEHFPDFDLLRRLFNNARTLVISTPWRPPGLREDSGWRHLKPGEHLHYFVPESLNRLLAPKRCVMFGDVEDAIRVGPDSDPNILTAVYTS